MSDKLNEMKKRRLERRRAIEESKKGKDYREYLENKQKASSLRYAHAKRDQKLKDAMERPQSKIDKYFEVNEAIVKIIASKTREHNELNRLYIELGERHQKALIDVVKLKKMVLQWEKENAMLQESLDYCQRELEELMEK